MREFCLALLTGSICALGPAGLCTAQTSPKPGQAAAEAERAAREEIVRRQEAQITARQLIDQGQKLYYDAKYEEAIAKLEQALKILPRARATEIDYNRAAHGLTDSYYRLADAAYRAGDLAKAEQLARKALEYDPKNRSAENIIVKVKQARAPAPAAPKPAPPKQPAPDETPEFLAKKDQIKKLFREGKILMNSGQLDEAEKRFQQILLIDPYNEDAHALLENLNRQRLAITATGVESTRARRLWEVTEAWVPPISREVRIPKPEEAAGVVAKDALRKAEIEKKLNDIIIPEINFREAVITDVISYLHEQSVLLDEPQKVGVNIVLSTGVPGAAVEAPPTPPTEAPTAPPAAEPLQARRITLSLRNIPLIDALKYVTTLAGLKYRIEPSAVLVLPLDAPEGAMITRSYPVNPGAFKAVIVAPTEERRAGATEEYRALGAAAIAVSTADVKQLFIDAGVPFPPGSSLVYNERTSTIIIRNTPENLEIFERVLAAYQFVPSQVEIEAKFVEISQADLDELGFEWKLGNKIFGSFDVEGGSPSELFPPGSGPNPDNIDTVTTGLRDSTIVQANAVESLLAAQGFGSVSAVRNEVATIRGILTNPQFELIIKALSQKRSADILSAPKVTTISGAQAQIRVVQEFIYPTEFEPPQVVAAGGGATGGGAVGVTPSTPGAFKTREIGVLLNVTPTVGADGYTINLTLIPEVSEFLGFINYGGPLAVAAGNNVVTTFNDIKQPLFSSRNLTTSIVIWDGQTVVLGGLIREDIQKIDDKVPFLGDIPVLGRLFRSKTTVRNKRNLLIFVTARLIDPAGNPIHRQETASLR
jgi:general secretion pathway protein D